MERPGPLELDDATIFTDTSSMHTNMHIQTHTHTHILPIHTQSSYGVVPRYRRSVGGLTCGQEAVNRADVYVFAFVLDPRRQSHQPNLCLEMESSNPNTVGFIKA